MSAKALGQQVYEYFNLIDTASFDKEDTRQHTNMLCSIYFWHFSLYLIVHIAVKVCFDAAMWFDLSPASPLPSFELWLPHYQKSLYQGDAAYIIKSSRAFPRFRELPIELQLHILNIAATPGIPPQDEGDNVLTDLHFDYRHNKETHPTTYSHYYQKIASYSDFNLTRALSQTSRLARWAALRAWEDDMKVLGDGSEVGYETAGKTRKLQSELVGIFRDMRDEVWNSMNPKGEADLVLLQN